MFGAAIRAATSTAPAVTIATSSLVLLRIMPARCKRCARSGACRPRSDPRFALKQTLVRGPAGARSGRPAPLGVRAARSLLGSPMLRSGRTILFQSVGRFIDDEGFQLAAALAYYSLLSMAPLFLIAVAVAGVFVTDGRVEAELVEQMRSLVGEQGAVLAETVIENTESQWRSSGRCWSALCSR